MLFNSYIFLFLFLPVSLLGYYLLGRRGLYRAADVFLVAVSLWFYGWFNVSYLLLITASITGNFLISLLFEKDRLGKKTTLFAALLLNLGLLFYFKYYDFFISNLNLILKTDFNLKHILLPLGISFFTFQQLSYMIDRVKGRAVHYGLLDYAAYVTFFPQLVAGPIVLHDEFVPQLHDPKRRRPGAGKIYEGLISFVIGLSKKVLLADTLANIVNYGFDNYLMLDSFSTLIVMTAYFLELYFDFSGYSDMAIGLGAMFGFDLPVNFNSPYKSHSLKELWSRWHMTLTRFMTTYVYIPLGGSRRGRVRTLVNVFIVFLLSGLWHGAAWTYVVWGMLTGLVVIWDNIRKKDIPGIFGILATDIVFGLLLIPFRSESLTVALSMLLNLFTKGWSGNVIRLAENVMKMPELYVPTQIIERAGLAGNTAVSVVSLIMLLIIGLFVISRENTMYIRDKYKSRPCLVLWLAFLFTYSVISLSQVSTFIYFNF